MLWVNRSILAALLLLASCTDDAGTEPPGVEAIYELSKETVLTPYPSDHHTVADETSATGLRVRIDADSTKDLVASPGVEETIAELNARDGFSTTGGVIVTFSGPIEPSAVAQVMGPIDDDETTVAAPLRDAMDFARADSPLILLNVDPTSAEYGTAHGLVVNWWEQAADDFYIESEFTLVAQPATPLLPATRYLFVVNDTLKAADGGSVHRSAKMQALIAGEESGDYPDQVRGALDDLHDVLGVKRERVALATVFTTGSVHEELVAAASAQRETGPPAIVEDWSVETATEDDGRVRYRVVVDMPEYRADDGRWVIEAGKATKQGDVGMEVFAAFSQAESATPRPVVIYAHGLGGDKGGCWGAAQRLSELNVAVFAIDSPEHGSRSEAPDNLLGTTLSFFGVDPSDQSFVIGRARDNFRQMAMDQLALVQFISGLGDLDILPPGAPDGVPDLDVSRVFYLGHSFGAVQGATVFALAPEISHAVYNVGGGGLTTLLRDSNTFSLLVDGLKPEGTSDGALARFFAVIQGIIDPGDPLNYARFGTTEALTGVPGWTARDVLLQEVIDDSIVPNSTSRALARAAQLQLVDAIEPISGLTSVPAPVSGNLPSGATGAVSQFNRMDGDNLATHGELYFSAEGRAQYLEFFRTALLSPHATIAAPYADE